MAHPLLLLLSACLLQLPATASPAHSPSCSPKACGNLTISYPFWLDEPGRRPCGPPSFQLKCNSSGAFLRRSFFESYRVVSIFNENNSFHVVDENLPLATGCPAPPFNISLGIGLAPFVISEANAQLLFLSSCKEPVPPAGFRRLSCDNNSFVGLGGERELASHRVQEGIPRGCHFSVVPILGTYDGNGDDYVARMRSGFLLEWAVVSGNCPKCSASGGECRYNDQGLGFACNCSGSMRPEKCGYSEANLPTTHRRFSNSPPLWVSALVPNLLIPRLGLMVAADPRDGDEGSRGASGRMLGNLTISDPFWITRKDTERPCGSLDYQADCADSTPILRSSSGFGFAIVNISHQESSLRVVDFRNVDDFNSSDCRQEHVPGGTKADLYSGRTKNSHAWTMVAQTTSQMFRPLIITRR